MSHSHPMSHELLGRDVDVRRLEQYLTSLATAGSVLLVTGEPGVGKSLLLDVAERMAEGQARVLRCAGVEFEAEVAYSGLHQALRPLRPEIRRLDETPRSAVQVALGLSVAAPREPLVVSNAVLELLERATVDRPLLMIVDDAQWLDSATAFTLAFVARRLGGTRLGLLVAARSGAGHVFQSLRVARHELAPLTAPAAGELLAAHFPDLDPRVRARLAAEARGNPLALLELPVQLAGSPPDVGQLLPAPLLLSERLQAVFAARLDELDVPTRDVVLLAALASSARLDVLERAATAHGGLQRLGEAERIGLLAVDDATRSVRFRHPLVRAAVVGASTHAERRRAHQALAAVFADEPDRHVWHLAAAAAGPDADVASLLEQAARRALRRGDGIAAVTTLIRSADLTPEASARSHRLAEAAYLGANLSGRSDSIATLIDAARAADATPSAGLYATLAAATVLFDRGEVETAHRMLVGGIEAHAGSWDEDDDAAQAALFLLSGISSFLGTPRAWLPFRAGLARLRRPAADLLLVADLIGDPARASGGSLRRLHAELQALAGEPDPWRVAKLCAAAMFVDGRHHSPEPLLRILRRGAEEDLAPMMTLHAHHWLSVHYFRTGEWRLARQHLEDGRRRAGADAFASLTWLVKDLRALLAAVQGEDDVLAALDEEGLAWAGPRAAHGVLHALHQAAGLAALGRGRYDEAFRRLALISPPGTLAPHAPRALATCLDLVEAALRSGRRTEARAHAAVLRAEGIAALSPRLALLVAASGALVEDDDAVAVAALERAVELPEIEHWPFDQARVHLALGERLRRSPAPAEARTPLRTALATFERLGARPWAERARAELLATGQTRAGPDDGPHRELTAQERQIAELAAGGLTNRQIGARLYLSHRTVGSHLHHVFPKLGISSRAALRDALNRSRMAEPRIAGPTSEG